MSLQNTLSLEWMISISKPNGLEYIIANKEKLGLICIILFPLKEDFSFDQTGKFSCPEIKFLTALNKTLNISCFPNEFFSVKWKKKFWLKYWSLSTDQALRLFVTVFLGTIRKSNYNGSVATSGLNITLAIYQINYGILILKTICKVWAYKFSLQ